MISATRHRLVAFFATMLYAGLVCYNVAGTFSMLGGADVVHWEIQVGFSTLVGCLYLSVGILSFLYLRQRILALVVFAFGMSMAVSFALETTALISPSFFNLGAIIADAGSTMALYLFDILLLLFPHNYFFPHHDGETRKRTHFCLYSYLSAITGLAVFLMVGNFDSAVNLTLLAVGSLLIALASFGTLLVSYTQTSTPRKRQQMRLLAAGMILAYVPFVVLTVLPTALPSASPAVSILGAQFSTLAFGIVPVALGYALLRYHLLVIDRHIRIAVTGLVGGFCLGLWAYLVFVFLFTSVLATSTGSELLWVGALCVGASIPLVWKVAPFLTDRLLFDPELSAVHHLLYDEEYPSPLLNAADAAPLESVVQGLLSAVRSVCKAPNVCFLAAARESNTYQLIMLPSGEKGNSGSVRSLFTQVAQVIGGSAVGRQEWLDGRAPAFARLERARRPLFLSELRSDDASLPVGWLPRFIPAPQVQGDPLLVPVRGGSAGLMGVLVLGSREEYGPYAGPDFAPIEHILARFAGRLEVALADDAIRQHVALLCTLYRASTLPSLEQNPLGGKDLALLYGSAIAASFEQDVGIELWLFDASDGLLRRAVNRGNAPRLPHEVMKPNESDWSCWFQEGNTERSTVRDGDSLSFLQAPDFPFAWLPLQRESHHLGVLVLTFSSARTFSQGERQILEIFAHQLTTIFLNAQIASELSHSIEAHHSRAYLKRQRIRLHLELLRNQLYGIQRSLEEVRRSPLALSPRMLAPRSRVEVEENCVSFLSPLAPKIDEVFTTVERRLRESQRSLQSLLRQPEQETGQAVFVVGKRVREEVNAILGSFEPERDKAILIITADRDYAALLTIVLSMAGYAADSVSSCEQALARVLRSPAAALPVLFLLDPQTLGTVSRDDFARQMQQQWREGVPFAPVLLWGEKELVPFTVRPLLESVEACIHGESLPPC